jgi:hypothetical protein
MTITTPVRIYPSDGKKNGGLFEPSTVRAVWRTTDCDESITSRANFLVQWVDYYNLRSGAVGKDLVTSPAPAGGAFIESGLPANRLSAADPVVGYEVIRWDVNRVPDSRTVWEVSAELQLLEAIPGRGHTVVTATTRSRTAQAWRTNCFEDPPPSNLIFTDGTDPIAISCEEADGIRVDINGQPMQINLDQRVFTISFVIRAPYYDPSTDTTTTPTEWAYFSGGIGASMVGNRNNATFFGWPAYSLLLEELSTSQIGQTTFHQVTMKMVYDEWWHLEQAPATINGSMPPNVAACTADGKTILFQTEKTLWVNTHLRYSDFNDLLDYIPFDSRDYIEDAMTITAVPY